MYSINVLSSVIGAAFLGTGLFLFIKTNLLFVRFGQGTLAPWDPPTNLVVRGIYGNTRNPMILGVLCILFGEVLIFGSILLFCWFILFFFGSHLYFKYSEEPGLLRRFGDDYLVYMNNVPRWIPRIKPWMGLIDKTDRADR